MAAGRKTGGRDYKPGHNSPGPGRPPIPFDEKEANRKIKEMRGRAGLSIQTKIEHYSQLPMKALLSSQANQDLPAEDLLIIKTFIRSSNDANMSELGKFKTLAAGPEPKQVELSGPDGEPLSPLLGRPVDELLAVYEEVQRQLKERECKSTGKSQRG